MRGALVVSLLGLTSAASAPGAFAVVPSEGESLPFGTVVEGVCRSSVGSQTVAGEQWTLETVDPQRARLAAGSSLAPPGADVAPGLVPFGDFFIPPDGLGEHSHVFEVDHDPRFSGGWGWQYLDQWALNMQGGSNTEELPGGAGSTSCSAADTFDTSPHANPDPGLGTFAGQFQGDSVASNDGLAVDRPGPYALDQWRLEFQYMRVGASEFTAHPFIPKACGGGSRLFLEEPTTEQLENVARAEIDYRIAGPSPEIGTNGKGEPERFEWRAKSYCLTANATDFVVDGAPGKGSFSGDMSQWPASPYINQFAAGARLGLPGGPADVRPGAEASGPAAVMMGMLDSLGSPVASSWWPSLNQLYAATVDGAGNFDASAALKLLQELGWRDARLVPLPGDSASVADAGPPYPIVYPNVTNEAAIDKALESGPVAVDTALGTDEWGKTSGGHVILIVGIDPSRPGEYIVDDPAGNYFSAPAHHYGASSYGYEVDYPKAWVLAYATNTMGRGLIEFGTRTSEAPVVEVSDVEPAGPNTAASFYLESQSGQRSGWLNGQPLDEIPGSRAGQRAPWDQDVAGGDSELDPSPAPEPMGPFDRFATVSAPSADVTLHVVAPAGGGYALSVAAGSKGSTTAAEELRGSAFPGADTILTSPALRSIEPPSAPLTPPSPAPGETSGSAPTGDSAGAAGGGGSGAAITTAEIRTLLARELTPSHRAAMLAALRRRGAFSWRFRALEAGTAVVSWYQLGNHAHKGAAKPPLLARAKLVFTSAATKTITLELTPRGRALLARNKQLELTARATFTPRGGATVAASRGFLL